MKRKWNSRTADLITLYVLVSAMLKIRSVIVENKAGPRANVLPVNR